MCTNPRYISVAPSPVDYLRGNATRRQIPIPCGKCFECLAARQNSFMIRAYREAQKYGSMYHLTLTYDEKHLPVAQSVWRTDTETGLMIQVDSPFVEPAKMSVINERHYPRYSKRVRKDGTRRRLKDKVCFDSERVFDSFERELCLSDHEPEMNDLPRILELSFNDFWKTDKDDFRRYITPSASSKDIQDWIRYCKDEYSNNHGTVPDFRYMCFLEYGPNSTRRPHWHFILINSDYAFAKFLFHAWKVGFCKVFKNGSTKMYFGYGRKSTLQKVNLYSKRYKGNGFKNVAGYVSKYVAKGCFDSPAVNMRLTAPVRVLTSKHFGAQLTQQERRHFLALDLYHYNPNCLDHVSPDLLSKIVDTIIRRLHFYFDESCKTTREERKPFPYKLPKVIQAVIFDKRLAKTRSDLPRFLQWKNTQGLEIPPSGKTCYNAIYYAVSDALQRKAMEYSEKELREYIIHFPSKDISQAVASFNAFKQGQLRAREEAHKENLLSRLRKSRKEVSVSFC